MARGIGDTLRASRRQQQLTLAQAAAEIRVREPYLAALEDEKFNALGGDVYVRAFLRGYSEYLGLDADQMVDTYRREHERDGARHTSTMTAARPLDAPPTLTAGPGAADLSDHDLTSGLPALDDVEGQPPRRALILAGVVLMLIGAAVIAMRFLSAGPADTSIAGGAAPDPAASVAAEAPAPETPVQAAVVPQEQPTAAPQPSAPAATPQATAAAPSTEPLTALDVQVSLPDAENWMRVTVDGVEQLEGLQPAGYSGTFSGEESVELRIGDASRARILLNGVDQGQLGPATWVADIVYRIGEPPSVTTEAP